MPVGRERLPRLLQAPQQVEGTARVTASNSSHARTQAGQPASVLKFTRKASTELTSTGVSELCSSPKSQTDWLTTASASQADRTSEGESAAPAAELAIRVDLAELGTQEKYH